MRDVVVVGGGLAGLFSAYWCVQSSLSVAVVSRSDKFNASGLEILNSYVAPCGGVRTALKSLVGEGFFSLANLSDKNAILGFLKPRLMNRKSLKKLQILNRKYAEKSYEIYKNLALKIGEFSFSKDGSVALFFEDESYKRALEVIRLGDEGYEILSVDESRGEFGLVGKKIKGAIKLKQNAVIDAQKLYENLKNYLKNNGVEFIVDEITDYEVSNGGIAAALGKHGRYEAKNFIQATGVDGNLAKKLGVDLELFGAKIYEINFDATQELAPKTALLLNDLGIKIAAQEEKITVTAKSKIDGASEFDMSDVNAALSKLKPFCEYFELKNPEFKAYNIAMTPNFIPIFGRDDGYENLIYLSGFGENEALFAPYISKILINLIKDGTQNSQCDDVLLFSGLYA